MPDLTALPPDLQTIVWWLLLDVFIVSVATVAILTTIKQIGKSIDRNDGKCFDRPAVQVALTAAPLIIGAALGLVPGLFTEFDLPLQAVLGLASGFMSPAIYGALKRRMPGLMVSKEARNGAGNE